jgi:hypothetical protein
MRPWTDTQITERNKEIEAGILECEKALADLDKPTSRKETYTMNAIAKFETMVEEFKTRGMSHAQAVREVVVRSPDVHKAYLREFNAMHGRVIG